MSDVASRFGGGTAQPDPLQRFLQRVVVWSVADLPDSFVNVHAIGGTSPPLKKPYSGGGQSFGGPEGLWRAISFVQYLNGVQAEVFFCISAQSDYDRRYSTPSRQVAFRKGIKACWLKSFGLDLDVKPGAYPSQRAALAAVLPFLDGLGLKSGPIVSSGAGLHVWITLDQPIPPDRWRPLAAKLAAAAKAAGLHFDQSCTVNPAGLWRMPGSTHRKDPNNLREVKVLGWGEDVTVEAVTAALADIPVTTGGYTTPSPRIDLSFLPPRPPINGPDADRVRADLERSREATSFDLLRSVCGVVADSERRGGDGDIEPLWFELGKLLRFVQDGRAWFHRLSEGDVGRYDPEKTDAKYDGATSHGWPRCATIAASSGAASAICERCPYLRLNLTPIHHAINRAVLPQQAVAPGQVNGHSHGPEMFGSGIPYRPIWLPDNYPYNGGVIEAPDGTRILGNTPILNIAAIHRAVGKAYEHMFQFTTLRGTSDADDTQTFEIPMATLGSRQKLSEALGVYGIKPCKPTKGSDWLDTLMTDLLTRMRELRLAHTETRHGWVKDSHGVIAGWAYGGWIYDANGKRKSNVSNEDFTPHGTLPAWREAANAYVGKGCVAMEVVIAASIGAALLEFGTVDGGTVFTFSSGSGKGKSAALHAGATIWQRRSSILGVGGSEKGTMLRMFALNNLPLCFDELIPDGKLAREFSKMVKAVSAGSEGVVSTRTRKETEQRTSRSLLIANSNKSLIEVSTESDTNSQAARVLEFEMPDDIARVAYTPERTAAFRRALDQNWGVGGEVISEYFGKNYVNLEQAFGLQANKFAQELQYKDAERFWLAIMTAVYLGASIGKLLGLFDFDLPAIRKFLIDNYLRQRAAMSDTGMADDPDEQLQRVANFLNDNLRGRIITDFLPSQGPARVNVLNFDQLMHSNSFVARVAKKEGKLWVSEVKLREWCATRRSHLSYTYMRTVLVRYGYCERSKNKRKIGGNCGERYITSPEIVLEFDLTKPCNANLNPPDDVTTGETDAV